MANDNLVSKQIINKNGVKTTVRVKPEEVVQLSGNLRMVGVPMISIGHSATWGDSQRQVEINSLNNILDRDMPNNIAASRISESGWKTNSANLKRDIADKILDVLEDAEANKVGNIDELRDALHEEGFFLSDDDEDGQLLEDDESVEHYHPNAIGNGKYEVKDLDFTFQDKDDVFDDIGSEGERTLNIDKFATFIQETTGEEFDVKITPTKKEGSGGGWPECKVEGKAHNMHCFLIAYERMGTVSD